MIRLAAAFFSSAVFALGLVIGGMTRTEKVIAFLDVTGPWDPTLAFVMGAALLVHFPLYALVRRREAPLLAPEFRVPDRKEINLRLVGGAALFGVGWGTAGFCPGPGLASVLVSPGAVAFAAAFFIGSALAGVIERRRAS